MPTHFNKTVTDTIDQLAKRTFRSCYAHTSVTTDGHSRIYWYSSCISRQPRSKEEDLGNFGPETWIVDRQWQDVEACHRKDNNMKDYVKILKFRTPEMCCNHPKRFTKWLFLSVLHPKDAEGIANSVDPDQTAPLRVVWSGFALFAQTCLSENLGTLRYFRSRT